MSEETYGISEIVGTSKTSVDDAIRKGIAKAETHAKADGSVTAQERKRLHHMQNKASRDIRHEKHDAQNAKPAATPTP